MGTLDRGLANESEKTRLIERFLTAYVGGDTETLGDLLTEDCIVHQPRWPRDTVGRNAIIESARDTDGTFADVHVTVEEIVVDERGERVAAFVTAGGRNVGPLRMEDREIAPTGRTFEVPQFGIYRLEDGRIAEAWLLADALGIVEQLDNLPTGPGKLLGIALRQLRWRLGGRKPVR